MEEKELNIHVTNEEGTITILHGDALPQKEPISLDITGQIDTVTRWVENRVGKFESSLTHIKVDRKSRLIILDIDAKNPYGDCIIGKLTLNPDLKPFGINQGNAFDCESLAQLIRMNRALFENLQDNMKLFTILRKLKAKVNTDIEKEADDGGNRKVLFEQKVEHNAPKEFELLAPIFNGGAKVAIKIEMVFTARNNDINVNLISPEMKAYIDTQSDELINNELAAIKEITTDIVIVEV